MNTISSHTTRFEQNAEARHTQYGDVKTLRPSTTGGHHRIAVSAAIELGYSDIF